MRVLLTPVADRPECARALSTAFNLGHRLGASVKGCHIRPHRGSSVSLSPEFARAAWDKKVTKKTSLAARTLFKRLAEANDYEIIRRARVEPGALYSERVGSPDKIIAIEGPVSDLIIVSRPKRTGSIADLFMRSAIFESARPVLVLPPAGRRRLGQNVCIAWDQGPTVARTVAASLPLLQAADRVSIVSAGPEDLPGPKSQQLASYLAFHGIRAERIQTRGRHVHAEIMDATRSVGADLLIAGAYSRNRWFERVFGGTTEFLLYETRLPVLVQHS